MNLVYICSTSIQSRATLISEQSFSLKCLMNSINSDIGIERPLSDTYMLVMASHEDFVGNISTTEDIFVVRSGSLQLFNENCGCAAEESFMGLATH